MKHKTREERRLSTHVKVRIAYFSAIVLWLIALATLCSGWAVI